ncbi:SubName: Full=Uncharacterized protein {ECO:0000313/EMBL:CCA72640.1} [Serendipita indica DSM 11827]|uniref:Uncharacterized protein n=1 Tax=Serendipita indica (strain DSM 11827) TaxID=1109443 RepID=G4TMV2_SERID|nr:SubName: Full=Uncharacterized protein {ECO:0000313/EMBL:CCA72640.1} [Serendipita indica DSM 11827]CCA72640.1 hypothetical protein PIIN_06577 [Serendipita indica DSM 11827]
MQNEKGQQKKRSAVQPDEIIAHLRVLAVFHKLKLDVQARSPHNPTGLWNAFLGYAVEKFASWISNVVDKDGCGDSELREDEFPTLDVAMIWHAYILNPLEYHNDCQKSQKGLLRIKSFPVTRLAEVIDTLGLEPRFPVPEFGTSRVRIGPQFSLDLVAAVKRQASFIAQVAAVGWTQRPKDITTIVSNAINRYHCFLKKLWENPMGLAVPTLEIDLAWHTHQLNIEVYRQDSMMLFGRILQHDDDIPSPELNRAFNRNSYDWKQNLFHMDYSTGSICTGFRPVQLSAPNSPKRSSWDSQKGSPEISLQDLYIAMSEKRLSGNTDSYSATSSRSSLAPSSSSGRGSTSPSPSPSLLSPSGSSETDSLPSQGNGVLFQTSHNDSTATISARPSNNVTLTKGALTESPMSSTSDLDSIFAYSPPRGWNEARGAFDRPPSCLRPSSSQGNSLQRPSSASSASPTRPPLRRHHTSNSAGALYVPEIPSPLSRPPEVNQDYFQDVPQPYQTAGTPLTLARQLASERKLANDSAPKPALSSPPTPPSSFRYRPSSSGGKTSGNTATHSPPLASTSTRPSTSSGHPTEGTSSKSIGGSLSRLRSFSSRPTTPDPKSGAATTKSNGRPMTAPQPSTKQNMGSGDDASRSHGLFRKKSKSDKEKSPSSKKSWYKLW